MEQPQDDLGKIFAHHVVATSYVSLPAGAVRAAKQSTLDTVGVILGASGLQEVMPGIVDLMTDWGGKREATVFGFGGSLPAHSAAFVNGAMAHGLDFDDHLPEGHHPSAPIVPALFAIAERLGGVTGEDFITALAVAQDIFARMRKYVTWKQDWFMTPVIGAFAATAGCAKLLGLSEREVVSAFGVAGMHAAGVMQVAYGTGGELRGTYDGFAAKAGVFSALLVQNGLTGTTTPLEGRAGFFETYFDNEYDRGKMVADLGTRFEGETIVYKLWPSCGASHGYIDATLRLLGRARSAAEIERIDVIGGDFARRLSEPIQERRVPASVLDAKFSIPYTVALATSIGSVGVGDFSAERRSDPAVTAVAEKIHFVDDPRYNWTEELPASAVRITLTSGEVLEAETSHRETPGSTERPLSWDDLTRKFLEVASHAVRAIPQDRLAAIARDIQALEDVNDVADLARRLG